MQCSENGSTVRRVRVTDNIHDRVHLDKQSAQLMRKEADCKNKTRKK